MFPVTDDSATIVDCLMGAAEKAGVKLRTGLGVRRAAAAADGFAVALGDGETVRCDRLLLATGGGRASAGFAIAQSLGHVIEPLVPSLFTFHIDDPRIKGLEGVSAPDALVRVRGTGLSSRGPLLITHWGMSGPAVLKLSAWAALELAACDYRFALSLSWVGDQSSARILSVLEDARRAHPKRQIATWNPVELPGRLWERVVESAGIAPATVWTSISNASLKALASELTVAEFTVSGKSLNKEEFVTCGGVRLSEVDFKTMESRICPGLYLAGEVLDIDGLTGGYNLQSAWTTGWLAGVAMGGAACP